MHPLTTPLAFLALLAAPARVAPPQRPPLDDDVPAESAEAEASSTYHLVDVAEGLPRLRIPHDEELVYAASVSASVVEATVGTVTMAAGTEPYRPGLLLPRLDERQAAEQFTGWLRAHAAGRHALYRMDATIETRFLPQAWPAVFHHYHHQGTENRQRELEIGVQDGEHVARYRSDTDHGAPEGTRIWNDPQTRDLPRAGTLETMGAIYLVRGMIEEDLERVEFDMLTKLRLWNVTLARGASRVQEVPAGRFDTIEIVLSTTRDATDTVNDGHFEGLFGIHGDIHLWVDADTGVPVRVRGDVPVGPITLGLDMQLKSYRGTPEAFAPIATPR